MKMMELYHEIFELMARQKDCYQEMLAVSRAQLDWVEREPDGDEWWSRLPEFIKERQALVARIDELRLRLAPLLAETGLDRPQPDGTQNPELSRYAQEVEAIRALLTTIQDNDRAGQKLVKNKMDRLSRKITGVNVNRVAANAYASSFSMPPEAYFFDRKK
jgi:hypothetical protein